MRGFRLNGWQRIGIVLSLLWAVGAWSYFEIAASRAAEKAYASYYALCPRERMARNLDATPCLEQAKDLSHTTFDERSARAWALALYPILIAWVLVYIVVWATRWIRRGFRPAT